MKITVEVYKRIQKYKDYIQDEIGGWENLTFEEHESGEVSMEIEGDLGKYIIDKSELRRLLLMLGG